MDYLNIISLERGSPGKDFQNIGPAKQKTTTRPLPWNKCKMANGYIRYIVHGGGGAVAQWIERATDNRVVARSNPTETAWKLWQFPLPHFASVFRKRH